MSIVHDDDGDGDDDEWVTSSAVADLFWSFAVQIVM